MEEANTFRDAIACIGPNMIIIIQKEIMTYMGCVNRAKHAY